MLKVNLYRLTLLLVFSMHLSAETKDSGFEKIFIDSYSVGQAPALEAIIKYESSVDKTNILDYLSYGRLAILSLQSYPPNGTNVGTIEQVSVSIADVYKTVEKINLYKASPKESFMIGMFAFDLMGIHGFKKVSFMNMYALAKDAFNAITKYKLESNYEAYVDIMLSIMAVYSTDNTTFDSNTIIMKNLSDKKIELLDNTYLKYLAYTYRAMFYKKVGYAKNAVNSLEKAKLVYPKAILHVLLEVAWSNNKSTF